MHIRILEYAQMRSVIRPYSTNEQPGQIDETASVPQASWAPGPTIHFFRADSLAPERSSNNHVIFFSACLTVLKQAEN